eukprot:TRINITY_DN44558_c0_g1_i1.p1 TRINITY_DN44558_c0_g1~~TRINITY_DN44558_c0_g1_i1.p1  ORF type:complete len:637 (+),score=78.28 TRINITY_DN44558_c0_g1_i1:103-2013(+)
MQLRCIATVVLAFTRCTTLAADASWLPTRFPQIASDGISSRATAALELGKESQGENESGKETLASLLASAKQHLVLSEKAAHIIVEPATDSLRTSFRDDAEEDDVVEESTRRLQADIEDVHNAIMDDDVPITAGSIDAALAELKEHISHARGVAGEDNILDRPAALDAKKWLEQEEDRLHHRAKKEGVEFDIQSPATPPEVVPMTAPTATPDESEMPIWRDLPRPHLPDHAPANNTERVPKAYAKAKLKEYHKAICAGQIIETTLWVAEATIQMFGAVQDCRNVSVATDWAGQSALCARQIFVILRSVTRTVRGSILAHSACSGANVACANAIADMFGAITFIGEFTARMGYWCRASMNEATNRRASWYCAFMLEATMWALGPLGGSFTRSTRVCVADPKKATVALDYGWCVGEVLSTIGYVAAMGLTLYYAPTACPDSGPRCAEVIIDGVHSLALGAEKADLAAGFCGGYTTRCGSDIALAAASLMKVGAEAARIANYCPTAVANRTQYYEILCTDAIAQTIKFTSVMSAKVMDASGRCKGDTTATEQCGSGITKALAAFSYIADQIALAVADCSEDVFATEPYSYYQCGRHMDRMAYSGRVVSQAISIATINCNLPAGVHSITKPLPLPARFYI